MNDMEVPIEKTSFDLGVLSAQVAAASQNLIDDRKASEARMAAADRKARAGRRAAYVGIAVAVVAIVVGSVGYVQLHRFFDERASNIVTACTSYNNMATLINNGPEALDQILQIIGAPNPNRTEEQQAATDAFVEQARGFLTFAPYRDCTDDGIALYYDSGGREGFLPAGVAP